MLFYFYQIITDQREGALSTCVKFLLKGLSYVYNGAIHLINAAYNKGIFPVRHLNKPVISVGNITLGGVGKTPVVILLAKYIRELKLRPVILTRGYRGRQENGQKVNDEVLLLREMLPWVPVLVGGNRFQAARAYLKENEADVFILDDGFQHRRLARDLDVVVLDTTNPFGNGSVLPRGILREGIHSLKRADIILLTKSDIGAENVPAIQETLNRLKVSGLIVESRHAPVALMDWVDQTPVPSVTLQGKSVCLLSAIGDGKSFESLVKILGMNIVKHFTFRDHYWYKEKDINNVISFCREGQIPYLVTTRKDSVKLRAFEKKASRPIRILILDISIEIQTGEDKFHDRIHRLLQR